MQCGEAGLGSLPFFDSNGPDPRQIRITEFSKRARTVSEELRMFFKQLPGRRAVCGRATEEIAGRKRGMLMSRGRGRFESYTIAKFGEARSEFRIFGNTEGRIEITGVQ